MKNGKPETVQDVLTIARQNAKGVGCPMDIKLDGNCKSCGKMLKKHPVTVEDGVKSEYEHTDTCQSCGEIWKRTTKVIPIGGSHRVGYMQMVDSTFVGRAPNNCPGCQAGAVDFKLSDGTMTKIVCEVCDGTGWASPKNLKLFKAGKLDPIEGVVADD